MNELTDILNDASNHHDFFSFRRNLEERDWSLEKNDQGELVFAHPVHDPITEDDLKPHSSARNTKRKLTHWRVIFTSKQECRQKSV